MTLEELLAALGKLPEGQKLVDGLKEIIAAKDMEIKTKGKAAKDAQTTLKDVQAKEKAATERLTTVLEHFEIDGDAEDMEEAIEAAKTKLKTAKEGGASAPEVTQLQKELSKLQRDFKKLQTTNADTEKLFQEERTKRYKSLKEQVVISEMVKNNIENPELYLNNIIDNVEVGDDDSLIFKNSNAEELSIADAVKEFATKYPRIVVNNQTPGANSGGVDGGKKGTFAEALLKSGQPTERLQQAENHYFGGSNQ